MDIASPQTLQAAADHLLKRDPILKPTIELAGLATFVPHTNYYGALLSSVIGQQISTAAAAAVKGRLQALYDNQLPTPEQILDTPLEKLREVGFSMMKARYVHDLAQHIIDGKVTFDRIPQQTNDEIIAELTDVKGIGVWTVHMFLMFSVGRLDILPVGDLGVRSGIKNLYGLEALPAPQQVVEIAEKYNWHPYESVASWYVWRSFDTNPVL